MATTAERPRVRAIALSAVVAVGTLVAVVSLVGTGAVLRAASSVSVPLFAGIALAACGWLVAWSFAFRTVLQTLGVRGSRSRMGLVFLSTMFADYLTPSAQAGSVPVGGLLVSRATGAGYATGMTAVAAFGVLNIVPSVAAIVVGASYLAVTTTLAPRLGFAVLLLLGSLSGTALVGLLGWRYRRRLEGSVIPVAVAFVRGMNRLLPAPYSVEPRTLRRHVAGVTNEVERLAWDRRGLGICLCFSALGWLVLSGAFWLSLYAVGSPVTVAVPLLVVPLSMTGNVLPLPGGVGGVEALLVALTVGTVPISLPSATAAALVYRTVTFGLAVLLGGLAIALLELGPRKSAEDAL